MALSSCAVSWVCLRSLVHPAMKDEADDLHKTYVRYALGVHHDHHRDLPKALRLRVGLYGVGDHPSHAR